MDLSNLSALIVSADESFSAEIERYLLSHKMKEINATAAPGDTFALIASKNADILIIDDAVPDVDGVGLTAAVRRDPDSPRHDIPIFIALDMDSIERILEAVDAGVHELLLKPVSEPRLYSALRAHRQTTRRPLRLKGYAEPNRRRLSSSGSELKGRHATDRFTPEQAGRAG